jgi:proteasome lid subunit RPN8/RPN11
MTTDQTPTEVLAPAFDLEGFPVFVLDKPMFDEIEAQGHNHYFVLASGKEKRAKSTTNNNTTFEDVDIIKLWRVTSSALGRAVVEATPSNSGIKTGTGLQFVNRLPRIPFALINKMDAFFRAVHKEHKSESIAMLVYDMNFLGTDNASAGWGAVIPKQKNTAAFCDYDPTSVIDELEDHIMVVGSAHSHPEMDAYASGTDHKDQADWDGIHITYGWKSHVKGGATEYYVETQYAGLKWAVALSDLAELAPKPVVPKEEIEDWLGNVTKGTAVVQGGYSHGGVYSGPKSTTTSPKYTGGQSTTAGTSKGVVLHRAVVKLPTDAPDPDKNTIIAVVDRTTSSDCPFCQTVLNDEEFGRHRCMACFNFITDSVSDDIDYNADREKISSRNLVELDRDKADKPIVLWFPVEGTFSKDTRLAPKK